MTVTAPGTPPRYAFVSRWELPVAAERMWHEIERMLRPGADLRWWPGVDVEMPPRRIAAGERTVMTVRSPLGYRLRMLLTITRVESGRTIAADSGGDLRGSGRVVVHPIGPTASVVTIHWDVTTSRVWMNVTARALRPLFTWAHARVMQHGERGLRQALAPPPRSEPRNADNPGIPGSGGHRDG